LYAKDNKIGLRQSFIKVTLKCLDLMSYNVEWSIVNDSIDDMKSFLINDVREY
jgi:hypothetical protein